MKWNREVFLHNVDELVAGKVADLDAAVGISGVYDIWKRGAAPTIDAIFRLCQTFDCDITWLINGYQGETNADKVSALIYIPKYRATLSGGGGSFETSAEILETCPFGKSWIRQKGNPSSLVLFDVSGDSMAPLILSGDTVMVDRSKKGEDLPLQGGIFAFREADTIKIKRLFHEEGSVRVISENKTEAVDYLVDPQQFEVIGEVVWVARDL